MGKYPPPLTEINFWLRLCCEVNEAGQYTSLVGCLQSLHVSPLGASRHSSIAWPTTVNWPPAARRVVVCHIFRPSASWARPIAPRGDPRYRWAMNWPQPPPASGHWTTANSTGRPAPGPHSAVRASDEVRDRKVVNSRCPAFARNRAVDAEPSTIDYWKSESSRL